MRRWGQCRTVPRKLLFFQARALRHGNRSEAQAQPMVDYLHPSTRLDPMYAPV